MMPRILSALVCFLGLLISDSKANDIQQQQQQQQQGGNWTDQFALLQFKAKITHDPLQFISTWNESLHFCHWQGVTCSPRHQRVTVLDLHSKQLAGSLSPFMGNLSFLKVLDLHNNGLHQEIPQQIGQLHRLQILKLENNSFRGQIPASISQCLDIVYLGLTGNELEMEIPMEFGSLTSLQVLLLDENHLSGAIPYSIGNLSSLEIFSVQSNDMEGSIPSNFGQLTNLSILRLGINRLSGTIPPSIYNLSQLNVLSLTQNQIHGTLPKNFGFSFPQLQRIGLGYNLLTGNLPVSLTNASQLMRISLFSNQFTGKVPSLGSLTKLTMLSIHINNLGGGGDGDLDFLSSLVNCTKLVELAISDNNFGGLLPEILSNFSRQLERIGFGSNHIRGRIPREIGDLINLKALGVEINQLTGSIPISIGKLKNLGSLYLNTNKLSGTIPSSIGNLTDLMSLSLERNYLEGSIPTSLGNCRKLLKMALSYNNLDGNIPKDVVSLSSLSVYLDLSQNRFNGSLPLEVGKLTNLGSLDISGNKLSGEIPSTLSSCTSLEFLHMADNHFDGTIPLSLSSLRGLQDLDLSQNDLSGQVPKFLEDFELLQNLNFSFNDFEGEVPKLGIFKNATATSIIGNKKLCGGVPKLQLPSCTINRPETGRFSLKLKLVISFSCIILGLVLIVGFVRLHGFRKKKRQSNSRSSIGDFYLRMSYQALHRATNGFSSMNLIGEGSFGLVYKGILDQEETIVAVKVFKLECKGGYKSFMVECEALRNIRHKNLVKILTACSSLDFQGNDFKALVYEFMANGSLEECLHPSLKQDDESTEPKKLTFHQRLSIAADVASAINYLHDHGSKPIIHCDLKPSNVLLDGQMIAHVGDFGLARILPEATHLLFSEAQTSSLGIKGTVGYAAPEYGMGSEVSTHGDIYSYGILLLEMITGRRPTDEMFIHDFNLHKFVEMALPERVIEIVDPRLVNDIEEERAQGSMTTCKTLECIVSMLKIGVACSVEQPRERLSINDIVRELHLIKKAIIENGFQTNH